MPYWHMKEATGPSGVFKGRDREEMREVSIALHDLIKAHSSGGYAVTFDLSTAHLLPSAKVHGLWRISPYTLCSYWCLMNVRHWAGRTKYSGTIDYHFERGHPSQTEADRVMNDIFEVPELRTFYRYASHQFSQKTDAVPLQAADVLAWHWRKNTVERSKGNPKLRKDLASLLEQHEKYFVTHFDLKTLLELLAVIESGNRKAPVQSWIIRYRVDFELGMDSVPVITQQELETPRSAAEMLAWVDAAHARFNAKELKAEARAGKHFANELVLEARPMALFARSLPR
jgi:hypothetical protein